VFELESQIRKWRGHLQSTGAVGAQDLEELESHLRDSVDDLVMKGIEEEEAFLVSIRRLGDADVLGSEFAKISTEQMWRQLLVPAPDLDARIRQRRELIIVVLLGVLAALLAKVPAFFGIVPREDPTQVFVLNLSLFILPSIAIYLAWRRSLPTRYLFIAFIAFAATFVVANLYPSVFPHHTRGLRAIHLPIALWLFCGLLYAGPAWRKSSARLDFVRFSGEVFIYSVLIALGGEVLVVLAIQMFSFIGIDINLFVSDWVMPMAAVAVPVFAVYLVEWKKSLVESIAPVLARVFTPLFLVTVVGLLIAIIISGQGLSENRDLLIWFDLLLALVLGLVLYTMSARDAEAPPSAWDVLTFALIVASIAANMLALIGIVGRLSSFGASANKITALGENVVLLVNLVIVGVMYGRFVARRGRYQAIVDLQMRYVPIYLCWAALVAVVFPPLFGWQ